MSRSPTPSRVGHEVEIEGSNPAGVTTSVRWFHAFSLFCLAGMLTEETSASENARSENPSRRLEKSNFCFTRSPGRYVNKGNDQKGNSLLIACTNLLKGFGVTAPAPRMRSSPARPAAPVRSASGRPASPSHG